jgi:uncharacterized protein YuzE
VNRHLLRVLFRDVPIEESDEDKPRIILDYDKDGNTVGIEVLKASDRAARSRPSHLKLETDDIQPLRPVDRSHLEQTPAAQRFPGANAFSC